MFRPSTADQILQLSDRYDVQIVAGSITEPKTKPVDIHVNHFHFRQYLSSLGIVGVITLVNWILHYSLAPTVLITFYLLGSLFWARSFRYGFYY
jgi:K+-sensing histidine kinase KdpD